MKKATLLGIFMFGLLGALVSVGGSGASAKDDGAACIKRQMAKGRSACLAKAQCSGITSRKRQAQICG